MWLKVERYNVGPNVNNDAQNMTTVIKNKVNLAQKSQGEFRTATFARILFSFSNKMIRCSNFFNASLS